MRIFRIISAEGEFPCCWLPLIGYTFFLNQLVILMKYKTTAQSELTRLESAWPPWCSLLASKAPFGATHDLPVARCFCSNLRSERWKNNFVILERENKTHILSFVALFFFLTRTVDMFLWIICPSHLCHSTEATCRKWRWFADNVFKLFLRQCLQLTRCLVGNLQGGGPPKIKIPTACGLWRGHFDWKISRASMTGKQSRFAH